MPNYDQWNSYPNWQVTLWVVLIRATIVVSLLLLATLGLSAWKKSIQKLFPLDVNNELVRCYFCWFVFSVFMFGFYRRGIYDYYFGIFFCRFPS